MDSSIPVGFSAEQLEFLNSRYVLKDACTERHTETTKQITDKLYIESKQTFEKQIFTLTATLYILIGIVVFCLILTIITEIKVVNFINGFEYVEETTYEIEQNEGNNAAIIGNESEVNITYGTDSQGKEERILEKKRQ